MKDPVRTANAVIYFRILRGLGYFQSVANTGHFLFRPCLCHPQREPLRFEFPQPLAEMSIHQIVGEFDGELGALCREWYGDKG